MKMINLIQGNKKRLRKSSDFKKLPRYFREYYEAVRKLKFTEKPNYVYLRGLFVHCRKDTLALESYANPRSQTLGHPIGGGAVGGFSFLPRRRRKSTKLLTIKEEQIQAIKK